MELKRVVITGLGALTPIGNNVEDYWNNLLLGVNGVNRITHFDATNFKTQFACELKGFDIASYIDRKESRKLDLCAQYAWVATMEAIKDSMLDIEAIDKDRAGVILGTGIGGVTSITDSIEEYVLGDKVPRFSPFFIPKALSNLVAGNISIFLDFRGPNYVTTSACASSANAIGDAFHNIQLGKLDVVATGGTEAGIVAVGIGGFNAMRALSTRNDDIETASRPFSLGRDGFVMGEGAGILILEEYEHAKVRNAKIYAEIVGIGITSDAMHITSPHPEGRGAMLAMKNAILEAGVSPYEVGHINTHGTSTPLGDISECIAINNLFGEHAHKMVFNSTKSMTGHLLGAASAIESIATILALQNGMIPPTINMLEKDPDIPNWNFCWNKAVQRDIHYALCNSFGFGGHNASILFKKN